MSRRDHGLNGLNRGSSNDGLGSYASGLSVGPRRESHLHPEIAIEVRQVVEACLETDIGDRYFGLREQGSCSPDAD